MGAILAKENKISKSTSKKLEVQAMKTVLNLEGEDFVKMISTLYKELGKEIDKIDKERNELAQNIKSMYKERLAFIKDAWSDKNLDKDEKKQIYNEYIDTSKALHQYLIDKEKNIEKAKARKEVMKDITFGAMVLTITTTAVTLAAKGVLSVYNAIKHN